MSFDSEFLYSALLVMAALHKRTLNQHDDSMRCAAYHFIDKALPNHRLALSDNFKDAATVTPALLTAILITLLAKLRSRCLRNEVTPYVLPLNHFYMQGGIRQVLHIVSPYIQGSNVMGFINVVPHGILVDAIDPCCLDDRCRHDSISLLQGLDGEDISVQSETIYEDSLSFHIHSFNNGGSALMGTMGVVSNAHNGTPRIGRSASPTQPAIYGHIGAILCTDEGR